ncbi:hypothetical protein T12_8887 [Trichinella patagoniensis]|uniref:Uncharacterized protein n=1 Tax=Trichinella patagoniensis TaxID=990121 RepID=A0A0V0ZEI8_9BILA|nr:hypothetical protein T12_8887 [Trichinella patagoniensis]
MQCFGAFLFLLMFLFSSVSRFQAQLIDFSMYHVGEVDITALYPHIQKVALIRSYHDSLVIADNSIWIKDDLQNFRFVQRTYHYASLPCKIQLRPVLCITKKSSRERDPETT